MYRLRIDLGDLGYFKKYVEIITNVSGDITMLSDNGYRVNAKSVLGVLSLDLSNPVTLICSEKSTLRYLERKLKERVVRND